MEQLIDILISDFNEELINTGSVEEAHREMTSKIQDLIDVIADNYRMADGAPVNVSVKNQLG